jgi:hypothetical protein
MDNTDYISMSELAKRGGVNLETASLPSLA